MRELGRESTLVHADDLPMRTNQQSHPGLMTMILRQVRLIAQPADLHLDPTDRFALERGVGYGIDPGALGGEGEQLRP